ncbi:MAG TPA: GNAT family N-acetyltransferase [Coriobacteriia bacterium]|nr:GNAT family N-acetyltransferase [Coriobacteriia bacterium]
MSRKLRPLTLADFTRLPIGCPGCVFWESPETAERRCGSLCDSERQTEWYHRVIEEWGECGRVAHEDGDVLGFVKYAPSGYFPQARTFFSAPTDPNVPLISCIHISPDARHHGLGTVLLRAALRDLTQRGERKVEAFALAHRPETFQDAPMLGMDFLLRNGFTVSRPDPHYPLLQLELKSLAVWTENLEAVLESLKLPLRIPERTPAPW